MTTSRGGDRQPTTESPGGILTPRSGKAPKVYVRDIGILHTLLGKG